MKIGIISSILLILVQLSHAQVTDTLGYVEFQSGTPTLYEAPNGGYAFGNNGYGDKAKAQFYQHTSPFVLKGVLMQFGDVIFDSGDSASYIKVNLYDNNGIGTTSNGINDSIAPDSVLRTVDIPVHQLLDDGSLTFADFSSATTVIYGRFSVGIDLTYLSPGDTVGLMSNEDGEAGYSFNAWEKTVNNDWFTVEESSFSWGLNINMAIFPVIDDEDPAGISDRPIVEFGLYPNPCADYISINVVDLSKYTASIHNTHGQVVFQDNLSGSEGAIDVSGFKSGLYTLTVSHGTSISSKQFVKL